MQKYLMMVAMVIAGLVASSPALSQTKKKQWCCTLGSKVASFKSQGEKTFGKVRNICLDSKNRPSSPTSIYVKKCQRVSGVWRVTPEVGAIQIVENHAPRSKAKNSYTTRKARKLGKKVRTKTVASKENTAAARQKKKARKKRVKVGGKTRTKSKATTKSTGTKVAKKARGKSGAKPKKVTRKKAKKKTKKKTKKTSKSSANSSS